MWEIWALFFVITELVITEVLDPAVVHGDDIYQLEEFIRWLLPVRVHLSSVGSWLVVARLVIVEMGMSFIGSDFYFGYTGV